MTTKKIKVYANELNQMYKELKELKQDENTNIILFSTTDKEYSYKEGIYTVPLNGLMNTYYDVIMDSKMNGINKIVFASHIENNILMEKAITILNDTLTQDEYRYSRIAEELKNRNISTEVVAYSIENN